MNTTEKHSYLLEINLAPEGASSNDVRLMYIEAEPTAMYALFHTLPENVARSVRVSHDGGQSYVKTGYSPA